MQARCYGYLIGCSIVVCILIILVTYHFPAPINEAQTRISQFSPFNQANSSQARTTHTSLFSQSNFSQTRIPLTSPFSRVHSNKTLSLFASLLDLSNFKTLNEIVSKCTAECVNKGGTMNPFFVYFIKTDPKLEFYEYVAVRSAVKFIKPDVVFVVTMGEMEANCWWKRTMALPLVKHVMIPAGSDLWVKKIRDKKVVEKAHLCDFMKQMLLYEFGGIYMDTDAIAVRSFDDLKNNQVTLAWDYKGPVYAVNGLMVSQRHSCFMCRYTQLSYQWFNGRWDSSGLEPLWKITHKELKNFKDVRVLDQYHGFFPFTPFLPGWTDFSLNNKKDLKVNTTGLHAVHLYHNMLIRSKEKGMTAIKGKTIDKYSWLTTSKSYAGELFRSVLPKHFTEEQFNTAAVCAPLFEDLH